MPQSRHLAAAGCAAALLAAASTAGVHASSHSEAPGTAGAPVSDLTDFYVFNSYEEGREDYVTFVMNMRPLSVSYAGPNYNSLSDQHYIELNIDNDGDAVPDLTFRISPGSRAGGDVGDVQLVSDQTTADSCLNFEPEFMTERIPEGVKLTVGEGANAKNISIPLKFFGPVDEPDDANLNWFEYVTMAAVRPGEDDVNATLAGDGGDAGSSEIPKAFDYAGTKTFPDYEAYASQFVRDIDLNLGGECDDRQARIFVGPRQDSFSIQLGRIFDLVNLVPIVGEGVADCESNNRLAENVVVTVALELPRSCLGIDADSGTFGSWATVRKLYHVPRDDGSGGEDHVPGEQVSRLGQPLVNELFIGLMQKNLFNALPPTEDGRFLDFVTHPTLPEIINLLFAGALNGGDRIAPTNIPRNDLVQVFLLGLEGINRFGGAAEYVRLNTSIPATPKGSQSNLGVAAGDAAGFPNGRRPGDDVVDVALRVAMGALCHLGLGLCEPEDAPFGTLPYGDGAPQNAGQFGDAFPYLNTPPPGATTAETPLQCPEDAPPDACAVALLPCDDGSGRVCGASSSSSGRRLTLQTVNTRDEDCD